MAALYLAAEGATVRLIGIDTPADQLVEVAKRLRADVVALSVSGSSDPSAAGGYLRWILAELPPTTVVWLGGANASQVREQHERLRVVQDWENLDVELARARAGVVGAARRCNTDETAIVAQPPAYESLLNGWVRRIGVG